MKSIKPRHKPQPQKTETNLPRKNSGFMVWCLPKSFSEAGEKLMRAAWRRQQKKA